MQLRTLFVLLYPPVLRATVLIIILSILVLFRRQKINSPCTRIIMCWEHLCRNSTCTSPMISTDWAATTSLWGCCCDLSSLLLWNFIRRKCQGGELTMGPARSQREIHYIISIYMEHSKRKRTQCLSTQIWYACSELNMSWIWCGYSSRLETVYQICSIFSLDGFWNDETS